VRHRRLTAYTRSCTNLSLPPPGIAEPYRRWSGRDAAAGVGSVEPAIARTQGILVVEDDPAILRLLVALLTSAGYDVQTAVDGEEALALCARARPAAVFLDVTLPRRSGWEVLAELRARGDAPPVVMLTADAGAARRALRAGAAAAILKPFDIDEVLEAAGRLAGALPRGANDRSRGSSPGHRTG